MKPIRLPDKSENSINMAKIEEITNSYDKFVKWIYKQAVGGNIKYFDALLSSEVFFTKFLKVTIRPLRLYYRCSAVVSSFAVDGKENIIVCLAFAGNRDGILGTLDTGFDEKKKRKFEQPTEAMCELKKYLIQLSICFWT